MSWSDGTPVTTNSNDRNSILASNGNGNGFTFTVPADTTTRTLYFHGYVKGASSKGMIHISLSDNSAAAYTDSSFNDVDVNYSIIYKANSPGQTLTVTWTNSGSNVSVGMYSASLSIGPGPLTIASATLPGATQYQSYTAPALTAWGGTPPYSWSVTSAQDTLPEGMTINTSTGLISSQAVGGQGGYQFQVQVQDSSSTSAVITKSFTLNVAADNTTGGCSVFPSDSIFHHRVDNLPVDTSAAAPIYSAYLPSYLRVFFGSDAGPNGIPFIKVPYNQPMVNMIWTAYGSESDPGPFPFPSFAPVEGTTNSTGDHHVLVLQTAGGGKPCKLYEVYDAGTENMKNADGSWNALGGVFWDLSSDNLRPSTWTSTDAAGLPVMPLTVNYDEVSAGLVQHPIRFTLNHTLADFVWPGRHAAGLGYCTNANGTTVRNSLISQSSPPASCAMTGPMGEIYRLKANVDTSICSSDPQASVILTAMKQYGIILSDNGMSGGIIGTPDSRWNNNDLSCLSKFTLSQFEPVNVSSLQVNPDSGATANVAVVTPTPNSNTGGTNTNTNTNNSVSSVNPGTISNSGSANSNSSGGSNSTGSVTAVPPSVSYTAQTPVPIPVPTSPQVIPTKVTPHQKESPSVSHPYIFTKYLRLGISNLQVKYLQHYLNTHGFIVANIGIGSLGKESFYFGVKTRAAVKKFQAAKGIRPAIGNVGPLTRKYISSH